MVDDYSLLVIIFCVIGAIVALCIADAVVHYRRGREIDEWTQECQEQEGEA